MNHNKAKRDLRVGSWGHSKQMEIYFYKKQQFKNKMKKKYRDSVMAAQASPKRLV